MRSILYLASTSVLALGLACAGPAFATTGPADQNAAGNAAQGQSPTRVEINNDLHKAGVTDRQSVRAHVVWAQSPSGQSVVFLIGPANMQAGKSTANFDENKLRSDLSNAGFKNIDFARSPEVLRGGYSRGREILAFESEFGARPAVQYVNARKLETELQKAGLSDSNEVSGQLFRAETPVSKTWFVLVAPKNLTGKNSARLSDNSIDKFERNGFINSSMYDTDITVVHGRLHNLDVIAVAGSNIGPTA